MRKSGEIYNEPIGGGREHLVMSDLFDLVIRGGTVVDGTGASAYAGDVAISDGRIAEVGQVTGAGREEIDATDRLLFPGLSMCIPITTRRSPGRTKFCRLRRTV